MNNESPPSARHDHGEPQGPESPGTGWLVVAFFTLFGFLATVLAVNAFRTYGWTLFVGARGDRGGSGRSDDPKVLRTPTGRKAVK